MEAARDGRRIQMEKEIEAEERGGSRKCSRDKMTKAVTEFN